MVCNPTTFTKYPSQIFLWLFQKLFQIRIRSASLVLSNLFLAGTSRSLLTYYKTNSSQSKDESRNPATLEKDLLATVVNEKLKKVHSRLKTLILDVNVLEFGLPKSDLRHSSWPKMKVKEDFLYVSFHPPALLCTFQKMDK